MDRSILIALIKHHLDSGPKTHTKLANVLADELMKDLEIIKISARNGAKRTKANFKPLTDHWYDWAYDHSAGKRPGSAVDIVIAIIEDIDKQMGLEKEE